MQVENPLFTVATVTYNSSKWVRQTIESVLASSFTDFEFLISDDCSTDITWDIIKLYMDPRIKAKRNDINLGEYPNRNSILRTARGKYIIYVDGDDMLYPNTLRNLAEYIAQWPNATSIWGVQSHSMHYCYFPVLLEPLETIKWIYAANIPISIIGFTETCFNTEALKKVGGFSEEFISGDTYIKKKLALHGSVLLVPLGFMYWRKSEGQATNRLKKGLTGYRENVRIDRAILSDPLFGQYVEEKKLFQYNCKVRDIKVLLYHTLSKGKLLLCWHIIKEFKFKFSDMNYLFKKADNSYRFEIKKRLYKGDQYVSIN